MSTKIWTAWRVPIRRMNELIDAMHASMWQHAVEHIEDQLKNIKDEAVAEKIAGYKYRDGIEPARLERLTRVALLLDVLKKPEVRSSFLGVDCGLNIWIDGRYAYVIPWGDLNVEVPQWAEDFHYQNQTDKPDNISVRKWRSRGRTWDRIALRDWDGHRLMHSVINMDPVNGMGWSKLFIHFMEQEDQRERDERDADEQPANGGSETGPNPGP